MSDLSQKTVFLLDHCHAMREPSGVSIEIDTGSTSRSSKNSGYQPFSFLPPIMKKLWTHAVENTLEYTRIVYDLFSDTRPIRYILNEPNTTTSLNEWCKEEQTNSFINEAFAVAGQPEAISGSFNVGIRGALKALSQHHINEKMGFNQKVLNKGRIIYVTSVVRDEDMESLFEKALLQHNESISSSDHLLQIDECEFVIISIHPVGKEHMAKILPHPRQEISALLTTHVLVVTPENINDTFVNLCVEHHDLVSLTVTGIPMKEEQKSQASFNYDVPLFHARMSSNSPSSQILRWSSPSGVKANNLDSLHPCNSVVRITPVDVYSRPSTCLSNFVINGRSVGLESPKKNKILTHNHILTSHGDGEMWMHSIETTRNVLEDPPSISEGMGGRVTDYRVVDFIEFMKQNMLVPYQRSFFDKLKEKDRSNRGTIGTDVINNLDNGDTITLKDGSLLNYNKLFAQPKDAMKERLLRKTKYWPMTINGSILFPMAVHLDKLLHLLPMDVLTSEEETDCDKTIWALMSIEARGEAPPSVTSHKKGHKRDEQWRLVYTEVENFIRANQYSDRHKKVLECFLQSRRPRDGNGGKSSSSSGSTTKHYQREDSGNNGIVDSVAQQQNSSNKTKASLNLNSNNSNNYTMSISDSPQSPDAVGVPCASGLPSIGIISESKESSSKYHQNGSKTKTSLATLWYLKNGKKDLRALPTNVKLYSHLKAEEADKSISDNTAK